jgi:hypothetical protein
MSLLPTVDEDDDDVGADAGNLKFLGLELASRLLMQVMWV